MKVVFKQIVYGDRCLYALDEIGTIWAYDDENTWSQIRKPTPKEMGLSESPSPATDPRNPARMRANPRGEPRLAYCPRTVDFQHDFNERTDGHKECIYCRFTF